MARFNTHYYWKRLGMFDKDIDSLDRAIVNASTLSLGIFPENCRAKTIEEALNEQLEEIKLVSRKYNLNDPYTFMQDSFRLESYDSGRYILSTVLREVPDVVLGLSGMPGVGKTTMLRDFEKKGIASIDEFWEPEVVSYYGSADDYEKNVTRLKKLTAESKPVILTAPILDPDFVGYLVYFQASPETRLNNLKSRSNSLRDSDYTRANHFELYEMIDFLKYGLQKMDANLVIDTSRIVY